MRPNARHSASRSAPPTRQSVWRTPSGAVKSKSGSPRVTARGDAIDLGGRAVGEKHRTGLRAEREHVPRAIVFLVAPRPLVLLDDVAIVLVERKAGGETGLHVCAHPQAIEVHARLVLDHQRAVAAAPSKLSARALIDRVGVRIGAGGQLELRARHAEEAERVAVGERARFVGADDVVGNGGDARGVGWVRTQRTERMERRHGLKLCH